VIIRSRPILSQEVRALLDRERAIPPVSTAVRARTVPRARAALAAGGAMVWPPLRAAPRIRWAAVTVLALLGGAALGAGAYEVRVRLQPRLLVQPVVEAIVTPASPAAASPAAPGGAAETRRRSARAAVARADFAAALPPVAEHARRFENSQLAEEREALRVSALAGLGRGNEARRAAAAFEARFPRSVLLPAIREMPAAQP
jgi:hypothetical protein